jgi:nucleotide-binding universal stress UspA family protein
MFKHLLVPIDGGEFSDRAMQSGIDLARQFGASITGFIAEPPAPPPSSGYGALHTLREMREYDAQSQRHARDVLAAFERRADAAGVPFQGFYAQSGRIDEAIVETAKQHGCDIIVMVTHGRGRFGGLLFRSHTHGVMARSTLPLLVLH